MSIFVEMPQEAYPADAITPFKPIPEFKLENARAMMWLSQLAYETAHERKVTDILELWTLKKREFLSNDPHSGLPPHSACVVVAEGRGAMFVTFAGSDPGKGIDWVTDFEAVPSPTGLHSGFDAAVGTVWPKVEAAIVNRLKPDEPVFFTGHSLGGALAILAAARAAQLQSPPKIVVDTFGSPRNGGVEFFRDYTPRLGDTTFRLIHGSDIVPTVPPTLIDVYHHVGCAIQCASGGLFDPSTIMSSDGNKPDLIESAIASGVSGVAALAALQPFHPIGPGLRNLLVGFLPGMISDHVPANYFRALSITVP
jgi:lipase (class 3)